MQKLLPVLFIAIMSLSCSDEEQPVNQENLYGFWIYKSVTYNGQDISKLNPGFTVSNYLHLQEDFTYGKCYILGNWSIDRNQLYLSSPSGNEPGRTFTVLSVSETSLRLAIYASPQEYGISLDQFNKDKALLIVETFERYKE